LHWKNRIKNDAAQKRASFVELHDASTEASGIKIHHGNFSISISNDFKSSALLRCLQVIGQI